MSGHSRPSSKGKEVHSHTLIDRRGQVQNVKAARIYIFGDSDLVEDESTENVEFEMPEVRARRGHVSFAGPTTHQPVEETYFEKEISEGETLQNLSLKYACPVSELKRINHLIKDQEFFALRVLKIPMRRHGYLSEIVKQENSETGGHKKLNVRSSEWIPESQDTTTTLKGHNHHTGDYLMSDSSIPSDVDLSDPETQLRIMRTVSIRDNFCNQGADADRFLKKMDKDLSKLRQSTITERESLEEVISLMTNKSIHPLQSHKKCNGADCGIRWWVIVIVAVMIGIFGPVAYILYIFVFQQER